VSSTAASTAAGRAPLLPLALLLAATLAVTGGYVWLTLALPTPSLGDPLGPQIFPLLICAGLMLCVAMLAIELWLSRQRASAAVSGEPVDARSLAVVAGITAWTGLYFFSFERAGFVLSTTLFLFGLMSAFNAGRWLMNACTAAGFTLGAWLLFVKVLSVRLPGGWLGH
jgi:putative tricarboxylic transport membrane protein